MLQAASGAGATISLRQVFFPERPLTISAAFLRSPAGIGDILELSAIGNYTVHTARTFGDAPWATTIGRATGEQAKTDDPEQTPARKKKSD